MKLLLAALLAPALLTTQRPTEGKVKIYVSAAEADTYEGIQQRQSDLEETARHIRLRLNKSKWLEVTEEVEGADLKLEVLGRRRVPDKGIAIGYHLDAGAYKNKNEYVDNTEAAESTGGSARDVRDMNSASAQRSRMDYPELAALFADSLEAFTEQNYQRIVAQRK